MGNNTFNNTFNKEASVAQGDNATANQYIYGSNKKEFDEKIDAMFEKLNENQAEELEKLTSKLFKRIDEKMSNTKNLSQEQIKEFENAKLSTDLKFKLKLGLPLSQLTGLTAEVEKEWKISKEIKPESIISFLKRLTQDDELQITNLNEPKQIT